MSGTHGRVNPEAADRNIRDWIGSRLVIADGSTGTALESLSPGIGFKAALLPLTNPALVEELHRAYFRAGAMLVETATFTASARSLERFAESGEVGIRDPQDLAYAVNRAGAEAAVRAAREAEASSGQPRWVAGSMGPGDAPPSFGLTAWGQLRDSYLPQARGLADGGVDLVIVETCQDPLQIKAALAAIMSPEGGRGLPFIVSATVDSSRRMLAGTSVAAFVAIIAPFKPLALGLNCSGGPDELEESLAELASLSSLPLCFMPNAGLPEQIDGKTVFPFGPEVFAAKVGAMVHKYGIAIAGGCCGTGPAHIASLSRTLSRTLSQAQAQSLAGDLSPAQTAGTATRMSATRMPPTRMSATRTPARIPSLASLYEAKPVGPGLFLIGQKANCSGMTGSSALPDDGYFDAMAEMALEQETSGAQAIGLCVAKYSRNEAAGMKELVGLLALRTRAALCINTTDPEVAAAVLPLSGGRALINSISLEDAAAAREMLSIVREHGAAVVCLAQDHNGPARSVTEKARICRELYDLATTQYGLLPDALFFDLFVLPLATEPASAAETLDAIPAIRQACPGSSTIIGLDDFSFGMPENARKQAEAVFLDMARSRGLDAVILDTGRMPPVASVDPYFREAIELRIAQGK